MIRIMPASPRRSSKMLSWFAILVITEQIAIIAPNPEYTGNNLQRLAARTEKLNRVTHFHVNSSNGNTKASTAWQLISALRFRESAGTDFYPWRRQR